MGDLGHPWDLSSLYDFQFFCCPECDYKAQERQYFVNHAYWTHPESIKFLSMIEDGSLLELSLPWSKEILEPDVVLDVKELKNENRAKRKKIKEESDDDFYFDDDEDYIPVRKTRQKQTIECDLCCEDFDSVADLNKHVILEHDLKAEIKCEECEVMCPSGRVLNIHYKVDHGKIICDMCYKICDSKSSLRQHMANEHGTTKKPVTKRVYCGACKWHGGKGQLKEHWQLKHPGEDYPYVCPECPHRTLTSTAMYAHIKAHHVKSEEIFYCTNCPYSARVKDHLTRHAKRVHMKIKDFQCEHCDNSYGTKRDLQKHLVAIHKVIFQDERRMKVINQLILKGKQTKCGKCDCDWRGIKGEIKSHWEEVHPEEPYPYMCDKCAHRTLTASALAAHVKNQHVENEIMHCDKCTFSTRTKERLKRHVKNVHLRVRDFQCEFCPSAFQIKQDLQKHLVAVHKVVIPDEKKMKSISEALGKMMFLVISMLIASLSFSFQRRLEQEGRDLSSNPLVGSAKTHCS